MQASAPLSAARPGFSAPPATRGPRLSAEASPARRLSAACEQYFCPAATLGLRLWCSLLIRSGQRDAAAFGVQPASPTKGVHGGALLLLLGASGQPRTALLTEPTSAELERYFIDLAERARPADFATSQPAALVGRALGLGSLVSDWLEAGPPLPADLGAHLARAARSLSAQHADPDGSAARWLLQLSSVFVALVPLRVRRPQSAPPALASAPQRVAARPALAPAPLPAKPEADVNSLAWQPAPRTRRQNARPLPGSLHRAAEPARPVQPPRFASLQPNRAARLHEEQELASARAKAEATSLPAQAQDAPPLPTAPAATASKKGRSARKKAATLNQAEWLALLPNGAASSAQRAAWRQARGAAAPPLSQLADWTAAWAAASAARWTADAAELSEVVLALCCARSGEPTFEAKLGEVWRSLLNLSHSATEGGTSAAQPARAAEQDHAVHFAWTMYGLLQAALLRPLTAAAAPALFASPPPRSPQHLQMATSLWLHLAGLPEPLTYLAQPAGQSASAWLRGLAALANRADDNSAAAGADLKAASETCHAATWSALVDSWAEVDPPLLADMTRRVAEEPDASASCALNLAAPALPAYRRTFQLAGYSLRRLAPARAVQLLRLHAYASPPAPGWQATPAVELIASEAGWLQHTSPTEAFWQQLHVSNLANLAPVDLDRLFCFLGASRTLGDSDIEMFCSAMLQQCAKDAQPFFLPEYLAILLSPGNAAAAPPERRKTVFVRHADYVCRAIEQLATHPAEALQPRVFDAWVKAFTALEALLFSEPHRAIETAEGKQVYESLAKVHFLASFTLPGWVEASDPQSAQAAQACRRAQLRFLTGLLLLALEGGQNQSKRYLAAVLNCRDVGKAQVLRALTELVVEPHQLAAERSHLHVCRSQQNHVALLEASALAPQSHSAAGGARLLTPRHTVTLIDAAPELVQWAMGGLLMQLQQLSDVALDPAIHPPKRVRGLSQDDEQIIDDVLADFNVLLQFMAKRNAFLTWCMNEPAVHSLRAFYRAMPPAVQPTLLNVLHSRSTLGTQQLCGHLFDFALQAYAGTDPRDVTIQACHALMAARGNHIQLVLDGEPYVAKACTSEPAHSGQQVHLLSDVLMTRCIDTAFANVVGLIADGSEESPCVSKQAAALAFTGQELIDIAAMQDDGYYAAWRLLESTSRLLAKRGSPLVSATAWLQLVGLFKPRAAENHPLGLSPRRQATVAAAFLRAVVAPQHGEAFAVQVAQSLSESWREPAFVQASPEAGAPLKDLSEAASKPVEIEMRRMRQLHAWQRLLNAHSPADLDCDLAALFAASANEFCFGVAMQASSEAMSAVLAEPDRLALAKARWAELPASARPSKRFEAQWKKILARAEQSLAWSAAIERPNGSS